MTNVYEQVLEIAISSVMDNIKDNVNNGNIKTPKEAFEFADRFYQFIGANVISDFVTLSDPKLALQFYSEARKLHGISTTDSNPSICDCFLNDLKVNLIDILDGIENDTRN